ncbi:MAG: hypothetical protein H6Q73_1314 [Firmicutes bacterium]|nr:hypothetical protein [Bacillota bacterium]
MDKIIEQVTDWVYLQSLPDRNAGFTLVMEQKLCGEQYNICSYTNDEMKRSLSLLYDNATKDFLVLVKVGLTEFYDISFITPDINVMEKNLRMRLEPTLLDLSGTQEREYESIFRAKNILEWPYTAKLPDEVAGFKLFINPQQALKAINGSYIIVDYSDFTAASNLLIYYNVYRDEFFGELRLRMTPMMTGLFDARELDELANKMDTNLISSLDSLRDMIVKAEVEE